MFWLIVKCIYLHHGFLKGFCFVVTPPAGYCVDTCSHNLV